MFWEPQNSSPTIRAEKICSRWSQKVSIPTISSILNDKHTGIPFIYMHGQLYGQRKRSDEVSNLK